jgi:hypothetical protein
MWIAFSVLKKTMPLKKRHRLKLAPDDKAFRRNAQPLETSNVPGGLGEHNQQANATDRQYRFVAFLQSVATPALLADVISNTLEEALERLSFPLAFSE